jgi:hypothetical protein
MPGSKTQKIKNPILEELFNNPVRVRLLNFFFHNSGKALSPGDLKKYLKVDGRSLKKELAKLGSIGILKSKPGPLKTKIVRKKFGRKFRKVAKRVASGIRLYFANPRFYFYPELKSLILKSSPISEKKLLARVKKLGRIKLAVLAGVFLNTEKARGDLLIVGDGISQKKADKFLEDLEAEAGREINLIILETEEFQYRWRMFDRFLRDFLEYPHEKLINKLRF